MTEPAKRVTLGVLTALLVAMLTPIVLGAWVPKVSKSEYDLHVQDARNWRVNHNLADSAWRAEQRELTLEIYCELKPRARKCDR